jgi:hypothetical protein
MLRDSPCGGTSKGATVAVTTRGVPLQMETNNNIFQISSGTPHVVTATVAPFDVPPQGLSRNVKYCSTLVHFMLTAKFDCFFVYRSSASKSSATSQCAFKFLVANIT